MAQRRSRRVTKAPKPGRLGWSAGDHGNPVAPRQDCDGPLAATCVSSDRQSGWHPRLYTLGVANSLSCRTTGRTVEVVQSLGCLLFAALGVGLTAYGGATGAGIVIGGGLLFVLIGMLNWAQLCFRLAATLEFDRDRNVVLWGNLFRHGAVSGAQIVRIKRDFKHRGMYKLLASRRTHVRFRLSVSKKAPSKKCSRPSCWPTRRSTLVTCSHGAGTGKELTKWPITAPAAAGAHTGAPPWQGTRGGRCPLRAGDAGPPAGVDALTPRGVLIPRHGGPGAAPGDKGWVQKGPPARTPGPAAGAACQVKALRVGPRHSRPAPACQTQAGAAGAAAAAVGRARQAVQRRRSCVGNVAPRCGCRWAGCRWAGCRWAGCRWAGCRWAGCRWAGRMWAGRLWACGRRLHREQPVGGRHGVGRRGWPAARGWPAPAGRLVAESWCPAALPPSPTCQRRGGERIGSRLPAARTGCPPHPSHGPGTRHERFDQRHRREPWQGGGLVEGDLGPDGCSELSPRAPTWSPSAAAQCWRPRLTRHSQPIGSGS